MGKTKDRIWKYYTTKSNNVYSCNYCNKTYFKNATRMKTHLIKCCKKCPKNIVDTFKDKGKFSGDSSTDNEYLSVSNTDLSLHAFMDTNSNAPSTSTCSTSAPLTPNRGSSQASTSRSSFDIQCSTPNIPRSNNLNLKKNLFSPSITGFMDSITSSEQEKLENQLARAIYSSYCPLSLVENPEWTKLFKMMRPSFTMPSRYKLSGPVLDQEFEKVKSEVETVIHHEAVTLGLQSDGWSNIRNEGIINVIITVPSPLLVSTIPTKISRHTGEYIADEMGKVIEKYGVEKFLGFVSDNAKNMQKAGKLLFEKYGIIYYGCAVHTLNLLTTDLIKLNSIRKLVVIIKKITVSIRQSQVLLALLRKKQEENKEVEPNASELQLPVKTRWSSIINCLRSVFNSKLSLQGLSVSVEGAGYLDKTVKQYILNDEFWVKISKLIDMFNPICSWIKLLEGDYATIHLVIKAFSDIKKKLEDNMIGSPINKDDEIKILQIIDERKKFVVKPLHCAADLLNPQSQGAELNDEEIVLAITCIINIGQRMEYNEADIINDIALYRSREGLWSHRFVWLTILNNPNAWWKGLCSSSILSKIAVRIFSLPASSAATERSFSCFSYIHNKKRNRLTTDRASKLVYIAHNKNLLHKRALGDRSTLISFNYEENIDISEFSEEEFDSEDSQSDHSSDSEPLATLLRKQ